MIEAAEWSWFIGRNSCSLSEAYRLLLEWEFPGLRPGPYPLISLFICPDMKRAARWQMLCGKLANVEPTECHGQHYTTEDRRHSMSQHVGQLKYTARGC